MSERPVPEEGQINFGIGFLDVVRALGPRSRAVAVERAGRRSAPGISSIESLRYSKPIAALASPPGSEKSEPSKPIAKVYCLNVVLV